MIKLSKNTSNRADCLSCGQEQNNKLQDVEIKRSESSSKITLILCDKCLLSLYHKIIEMEE